MYRHKYSDGKQKNDNTASQSYNKRSARIAAYRRKQRQRSLLCIGFIIIIAIIITVSILLLKSCAGRDRKLTIDRLDGTWIYDQYTKYEFDGYGNGCMCLEDIHYEYSYEIKVDTLFIDFDNKEVHDCSYIFDIKGSELTIVGGEGTTGGTYVLHKN